MNIIKLVYKYKFNALLLVFALIVTDMVQAQTAIPTYTNLTPPNTIGINFNKVCFRDSLNGFILSNLGQLFRTKDAGKTWNFQQQLQTSNLYGMLFKTKDTAFIVGVHNIFKSNDGGETWFIVQTLPLKDKDGNIYPALNNILFISQQTGFASGFGIIWKTVNGGNTWKEVLYYLDANNHGNIGSMHFTDNNNGIAFAQYDIYFQTTNGGETWVKNIYAGNNQYQFSTGYFFTSLYGVASVKTTDSTNTSYSRTVKTLDGGLTWNIIASTGGGLFNWNYDKNIGIVGVSQTTYWNSKDSGKTWEAMAVPLNYFGVNVNSIFIASTKHICIVGNNEQIFDSYDDGLTWSRQSLGYPSGFTRVAFTDSLHGHVCSDDGKLLNTNDGGSTWTVSLFKQGAQVENVAFPTRDTGYAVQGSFNIINSAYVGGCQLYHTYNGGVKWDSSQTVLNFDGSDFINFPTKDAGFFGVTFYGSVIGTTDAGKTLTEDDFFTMGIDGKALGGDFANAQTGFVACNLGEFVRTNDGGASWDRIDLPGGITSRTTHMYDANIAVAFTPTGYIFRTINNGTTWTQVLKKGEYFSYYFPIDKNSGYVATNQPDSIYYTKDQGLTWTKQWKGTISWTYISFVNPYLAYCANSNGIYRVDFPRPGVVLLTASTDSSMVHVSASKSSVLHVTIAPGQAMTAGNVYTVLLSDATGSFTKAVSIGSGTATSIDTITCNIPAGTVSGTGYRIKVTSSLPAGESIVIAPLQVVLEVQAVTLRIPLQQGWNLISTNVYVADSSITTLFAGKNVAEIKTQSSFWRSGQPTTYNSLTNLQAGTAYMVLMNMVDTLVVMGLPMKTLAMSLQTGWNVVGCSYQTTTTFSTAVGTVTKIKDLNQLYQSTDSLVPGKGYFIQK